MYFTKVELHNFGIYKGTHEMLLSDKIGDRNITLIGGLNGRGKTTFHDAIILSLYGKLALKYIQENARSYDKLLIDHINKHATDDTTYVAVTLCLDDGTELMVKRSWRANGRKAVQETTVAKNGVVDKYLGENWNYYIEEILPFGIARFFFFNNEKITQLADDVSFDQIKASIKSAIGVTTIEKAITHLDEVIRRKNSALQAFENSGENRAFHDVEAQIADINRRIEAAIQNVNKLELDCQDHSARVEAKEREFWASGGDLSRNREAIKSEMRKISAEKDAIQAEILQLASDASSPLFLCRSLVNEAYNKEAQHQETTAQKYAQEQMVLTFNRIRERITKLDFDLEVLEKVLLILNDEMTTHVSEREGLQYHAISATGMMLFEKLIAETFQTLPQKVQALTGRVDTQEAELLNLDAHLEATDDKTVAMRLYEALREVEREKTIADDELRRQNEQIESMRKQKDILMNKRIQLIKAITEKENKNDNNTRIIKYAAMSMEVLGEFKTRLQAEKVARLSSTVTECFKKLVEKDTLVSRIEIDPISLDVTIFDYDGNELLKSQLSAGEQQMFAVSIVWALALTSGYKAPVVIDTPMARLDSSNRANFVMNYLPAASSQVLVLSTDEEIHGRYHDMIRDHIVDYYTLLYREEEQCTSITHGYFEEA